jgi:hypothetical protein
MAGSDSKEFLIRQLRGRGKILVGAIEERVMLQPDLAAGRRAYIFWGTIAVTGVTDFEAALLVQSHCSHEAGLILTLVEA